MSEAKDEEMKNKRRAVRATAMADKEGSADKLMFVSMEKMSSGQDGEDKAERREEVCFYKCNLTVFVLELSNFCPT